MTALMNSIQFKTHKPITHFSAGFNEFVNMMLQKKKEDRPIITDLIDFLRDRQKVKFTFSTLDQSNYQNYKSLSVKQFETKRVKEKNMNSYNKDFDALKKRIQQGNKDFKSVMLK